jgi:hypothetical protein
MSSTSPRTHDTCLAAMLTGPRAARRSASRSGGVALALGSARRSSSAPAGGGHGGRVGEMERPRHRDQAGGDHARIEVTREQHGAALVKRRRSAGGSGTAAATPGWIVGAASIRGQLRRPSRLPLRVLARRRRPRRRGDRSSRTQALGPVPTAGSALHAPGAAAAGSRSSATAREARSSDWAAKHSMHRHVRGERGCAQAPRASRTLAHKRGRLVAHRRRRRCTSVSALQADRRVRVAEVHHAAARTAGARTRSRIEHRSSRRETAAAAASP